MPSYRGGGKEIARRGRHARDEGNGGGLLSYGDSVRVRRATCTRTQWARARRKWKHKLRLMREPRQKVDSSPFAFSPTTTIRSERASLRKDTPRATTDGGQPSASVKRTRAVIINASLHRSPWYNNRISFSVAFFFCKRKRVAKSYSPVHFKCRSYFVRPSSELYSAVVNNPAGRFVVP